jgi:hypothetical protein
MVGSVPQSSLNPLIDYTSPIIPLQFGRMDLYANVRAEVFQGNLSQTTRGWCATTIILPMGCGDFFELFDPDFRLSLLRKAFQWPQTQAQSSPHETQSLCSALVKCIALTDSPPLA